MNARAVAGAAITVTATGLGFATGGCGGGTTTSAPTTSMPDAAGVEEIVDEHPHVATIVCHNTESSHHEDSGPEHSHHEDSGHEHSHDEDSTQVAELDQKALGHVSPLAIEADLSPA